METSLRTIGQANSSGVKQSVNNLPRILIQIASRLPTSQGFGSQ